MRAFWRGFGSVLNLFPARREPPMTYAQVVRAIDAQLAENKRRQERLSHFLRNLVKEDGCE